jgi:hypothetical protein
VRFAHIECQTHRRVEILEFLAYDIRGLEFALFLIRTLFRHPERAAGKNCSEYGEIA